MSSALPQHLLKRDGSVRDFDAEKIVLAVAKAGRATNEFDEKEARRVVEEHVLPRLSQHDASRTPNIEWVQDAVEHALFETGHFPTLRAYIVYRESRAKARDAKKSWVNVESSINEYLDQLDWRVNANANQGYSLGGLILNVSGKVVANYWLNYIYPPEVGRAHREAHVHVHDLDMLSGYCAGWSLRTLLQEGLNGVAGKVEANAPKHLSSATGQIVNFLGTMQNEWAGAQAFSSFDTYLAPYIRKDNLPYEEVLQCIQELIYNLNVPSRWGTQTPFTNLTFDWTCPEDLKKEHPLIGGETMPFTYGELQDEMDMINRAYIEVMLKGDAGIRLGEPQRAAALRHDGALRASVLPEFHQFGTEAQHDPLDVLPPSARSEGAPQARQRPLRLCRADGVARRCDDQLRSSRLSLQGR